MCDTEYQEVIQYDTQKREVVGNEIRNQKLELIVRSNRSYLNI